MSDDVLFKKIFSHDAPLIDVIFIHGLTGDAEETWSSVEEDCFWPEWFREDLDHLSVYTLGYPASLFEKWAKKEMDIFERSVNTLEYFSVNGIGERPIVFVTHSLGGILTKVLLRKSKESENEDYNQISNNVRVVFFLSTPHTGSSLANALNVLPNTSKHIKLLANDMGFLEDLNTYYRAYANSKDDLITKVYYEKHKTKMTVLVVTRESADPGVAGTEPVAVDKDHVNICKPVNKDDIVYLGIRQHVRKLLDEIVSSNQGATSVIGIEYSTKSETDRRDLLQKLIDAEREHEYSYANDCQNQFARGYLSSGLMTSAREDHEILLSEVESRFYTHVYHPLICKGAEDEMIRESLQKNVIDPISEKTLGGTKFTSKAIQNALYYLTEQCHIRWDPV